MRKIFTILFALVAMVSFAQIKVNVSLNMNGRYGKQTEAELVASRGEAWASNWENVVKPGILNDMITAMNKTMSGKTFVYGVFDDAEYDLAFSMIEMDDDGETDAIVVCSAKNEDGSLTMLFSDSYDKNGNETKKFSRITSKSMVSVARSAVDFLAYKIKRKTTNKPNIFQ